VPDAEAKPEAVPPPDVATPPADPIPVPKADPRPSSDEFALGQAEERALLLIFKNSRVVADKASSDLMVFRWWVRILKSLEPVFKEGIERNNEFASRGLRDAWRLLVNEGPTPDQEALVGDKVVPLDALIARGDLARADVRDFGRRLATEARALRDLQDQQGRTRAFFAALPGWFRERELVVRLKPEEAKALANPAVQEACIYDAFHRPSYLYKPPGEYTRAAKRGEGRFSESGAGFLDTVDQFRIPRWFFDQYGFMCELGLAGYESPRLLRDYEAARQAIGAMLGKGPMPEVPPDQLFLPTGRPPSVEVAAPSGAVAAPPGPGVRPRDVQDRPAPGKAAQAGTRPPQRRKAIDPQSEAMRMLFGRP
jgi:hypothetical protein